MSIRDSISKALTRRGEIRARDIIRQTGFSRSYVHKILRTMEAEGLVHLVGKANRARYVLAQTKYIQAAHQAELAFRSQLINDALQEDNVFGEIGATTGILRQLPENVLNIVEYAFTEMLNNAIEHSQSSSIHVAMRRTATAITFTVRDYGVGIFANIASTRHLKTDAEAIQQLLKGKQTTMPERHSGEGIFFTSKAADRLIIRGSNKKLLYDNHIGDIFVRTVKLLQGTQVDFSIALDSTRSLPDIFHRYSDEAFRFDKTSIDVSLYAADTGYVSRSQARRLLVGLDSFSTITLNFGNVETIGQGFADEVFRVWKQHHPNSTIHIVNANESVQTMIAHVKTL